MKLIDCHALPVTPWKNGGGLTREVACHPPGASLDDFVWRISIADVHASGAFSTFAGIDRIIAPLDGDGMVLAFADGRRQVLATAGAAFRFRGEDAVHAQLLGGPSRDLNLMLRRDGVDGAIAVHDSAGELVCTSGFMLLLCARGKWQVRSANGPDCELAPFQALAGESTGAPIRIVPLESDSLLLHLRISPRNAA